MRLTIRKHNQAFLTLIANQMGCNEAEALNYILTTARRDNFSFSSPIGASFNQESPQITAETESVEIVQESVAEVDSDILRLINAGLDMEF